MARGQEFRVTMSQADVKAALDEAGLIDGVPEDAQLVMFEFGEKGITLTFMQGADAEPGGED